MFARRALSRHMSTTFGKRVASDNSPAQGLSDIGRGRFEYVGDFLTSIMAKPTKLEIGVQRCTLSEKELAQEAAHAAAMTGIQRALLLGSLASFAGCALGWWAAKKLTGTTDIREFSDHMRHRIPQVMANTTNTSVIDSLRAWSERSHELTSQSTLLATWRRTMRAKFNTPEGAELARRNSVEMLARRNSVVRQRRLVRSLTLPAGGLTRRESARVELTRRESAREVESLLARRASARMAASEQPPSVVSSTSPAVVKLVSSSVSPSASSSPSPSVSPIASLIASPIQSAGALPSTPPSALPPPTHHASAASVQQTDQDIKPRADAIRRRESA